MFLSNRGSFRPETSGAYTLRRRGRRRPKSGSAIGACAVARLAGSGGPIGDYYGSANTTLEEYNGYCAAGKDEQFYKPACFLQPVAEGPFYAMQYEPSAWVTIGGIRTNDRLQAIDDAGIAIPGLYVAGADNGTLMSAPYCDYEGFSLMCAYSGGRMAGMYAAEAVA